MSNVLSKKPRRKKKDRANKTVRVTVVLDPEELRALDRLAADTRRNRSQMVGWLVREAVRCITPSTVGQKGGKNA